MVSRRMTQKDSPSLELEMAICPIYHINFLGSILERMIYFFRAKNAAVRYFEFSVLNWQFVKWRQATIRDDNRPPTVHGAIEA